MSTHTRGFGRVSGAGPDDWLQHHMAHDQPGYLARAQRYEQRAAHEHDQTRRETLIADALSERTSEAARRCWAAALTAERVHHDHAAGARLRALSDKAHALSVRAGEYACDAWAAAEQAAA